MPTLKLFSISLFFAASCGHVTDVKPVPAPAFLKVQILLSGVTAESDLGLRVLSSRFEITDCEKTKDNQEVKVTSLIQEKILNLKVGNKGCKGTLKDFTFGTTAENEIFSATDGAYDGATPRIYFYNEDRSKKLVVEKGALLNEELVHKEALLFYVYPELGSNFNYPFLLETDYLKTPTSEPPLITVSEFFKTRANTDSQSTRELYVQIDCSKVLSVTACYTQNIYNYRFRIVEKPVVPYAISDLDTFISNGAEISVPTFAHVFGNGFRMMIRLPSDYVGVKEYVLISALNGSYRTFEFSTEVFNRH